MQGTRRDIVDSEWTTAKAGDYGKMTHDTGWYWYCAVPDSDPANDDGFMMGDLTNHTVTEHEDGTLTVSPSILIGGQGSRKHPWHGYLERGVWREV